MNERTKGKTGEGKDVTGEDIAGEDIAGEDIAGEGIAGEDIAGEGIAGEDVPAPYCTLCCTPSSHAPPTLSHPTPQLGPTSSCSRYKLNQESGPVPGVEIRQL
ncbi:hypothetical protein ACOMHN_026124 [Nucella lapillus]